MIRTRFGALLIIGIATVTIAACAVHVQTGGSGTNAKAVAEVRELDRRWADSYVSHDTVFANALLSDDILITSSNGLMKPKSGEVRDIAFTPGWEIHYFRTTSVEVHASGDAAVVAGLASWAYTNKGQRSDVSRRYTATYARGGKLGWRMIALHLGPPPAN